MQAPTLDELIGIAQRACALLDEGQVEVDWDLHLYPRAIFTAVHEGRAGREEIGGILDDAALARAAKAARLQAARPRAWPVPPLPAPHPATPVSHGDVDDLPTVDDAPPLPDGLRWDLWLPRAERTVVASTTGVLTAEEHACVEGRIVGGPERREVVVTFVSPGLPDVEALAFEAFDLLARDDPPASDAIVLGPQAMGTVLGALRSAFGSAMAMEVSPYAVAPGTPVAAPCITLTDKPRAGPVPRHYDVEGTPSQTVTLIRDGAIADRIHDASSAAQAGATSTGHASRALTLSPHAAHLALAPGDAGDLRDAGVYVPALVYQDGLPWTRAATGRNDRPILMNTFEILAGARAVSSTTRTVPVGDGAFELPAVLVEGGVTL